jgi:heptosyltransferase II
MDKVKKIIIRLPNWVGDFVMATPILTDIREKYPDAHITALCKSPLEELLLDDEDVSEVIAFVKSKRKFLDLSQYQSLINKLKNNQYDLGIILPNSFSSAYVFWKSKIRKRIGFIADRRKIFLNVPVKFSKDRHNKHLVFTYKELLWPLTIKSDSVPRLYIKEDTQFIDKIFLENNIPANSKIIGINPGAAYGTAKCWIPERFQKIAEKLLKDHNTFVFFFGDMSMQTLNNHICENLGPRAINLAGKTSLKQLCMLLQKCKLFLTNDSGPMHLASALNVPLIAIFGSTDENVTGPFNNGVVIHKKLSCSPCFKKKCPYNFECMKLISVDEVFTKIKELLN